MFQQIYLMMLLYDNIHSKKFRCITDVYKRDFDTILAVFEKLCIEEKPKYIKKCYISGETKKRSAGAGRKGIFSGSGNKLHALFYYLNNFPTMGVLADHFKTSVATCSNTLKGYFLLLKKALSQLSVLPVRRWKSPDECNDYIEKNNLSELIVDATERRFHRPKDKDTQKALYSGKKKAHTVKNTLIVDKKIHTFLGIYYSRECTRFAFVGV